MRRHELEHIIRAAAGVTNRYEFVIIGSQSILGALPNAPPDCLMSMEADIYPLDAEELSDLIDGALGEGSRFHETHGYYAQGVDSSTAVLPKGWKTRLVRVQSQETQGFAGYCLDPVDLFLAKCVANREKDRRFNLALLRGKCIEAFDALARVEDMPMDESGKRKLRDLIRRLDKSSRA